MCCRPLVLSFLCFFYCYTIATAQQNSIHNQEVFNGREYLRYPYYFSKGTAYFQADSLATGTVLYDGVLCSGVPLLYDQLRDQLITADSSKQNLIRLVKEKVDRFSINQHQFIHLKKQKGLSFIWPEEGYFEVIYNGQIKVLKKENKAIKQSSSNNDLTKFIESGSAYYLLYGGKVTKIKNERGLLTVFGDKKKEVRQFLKDNQLKFRKDTDNTIARTAAHVDSLIP